MSPKFINAILTSALFASRVTGRTPVEIAYLDQPNYTFQNEFIFKLVQKANDLPENPLELSLKSFEKDDDY